MSTCAARFKPTVLARLMNGDGDTWSNANQPAANLVEFAAGRQSAGRSTTTTCPNTGRYVLSFANLCLFSFGFQLAQSLCQLTNWQEFCHGHFTKMRRTCRSAQGSRSKAQQLGTDLQSRAFGGSFVDLKTNFVPFLDEIDHAPVSAKRSVSPTVRIVAAPRPEINSGILLFTEALINSIWQLVAFGDGNHRLDDNRPVVDGFVADDGLQVAAERIFPRMQW